MKDISYKCHFEVNTSKCTKCGRCEKVCNGAVITYDKKGYPYLKKFERFGSAGCWKCEHCIAVCPNGAISIFHKYPQDATGVPDKNLGDELVKLVNYRRSCRRYLDKNVDPEIIDKILKAMENVPTGGNSMSVQYTIIDDKEIAKKIEDLAYEKMEKAAEKGKYASSVSKPYYDKMKQRAKVVRKGDLLFCHAPHLFIAHKKAVGRWAEDSKNECIIADTYFELLANSFGLGTLIMSFSATVLNELALEARDLLGIPRDHCISLIIGFGYPEIKYARGIQKSRGKLIHRASENIETTVQSSLDDL